MAAFLGISLWIALATVAPGLVTMAAVYGAFALISPSSIGSYIADLKGFNEWVYAGAAITTMVLTQFVGILLEGILVHQHCLGPLKKEVEVPEGIDPCGLTKFSLEPYSEYDGLYLLLAELRENEDSQGHLQRAIAQFFLTNNMMVSFTGGILAAILMMWYAEKPNLTAGFIYIWALTVCIMVTYTVARIRFVVMAKALWAARRRRLEPARGESEKVFSSVIGE